MRTLSYSPSVEVLAMHVGKGGEKTYYDLSRDVSSCNVSMEENGAGTFDVRLLNRSGKYDGKFLPMDMVAISCDSHKGKRRLMTGYINSVTMWSLYPQDYRIKGSDALYRLQRLYWDPKLFPSVFAAGYGRPDMSQDDAIREVLEKAAGMGGSMVDIGDLPPEALDLANEVWQAGQAGAATQLERMADLLKVLREKGPSLNTWASGGAGGTFSGDSFGATVGLTAGQSIPVPTDIQDPNSSYTIYTVKGVFMDGADKYWDPTSNQSTVHAAWVAGGCLFDSRGIAILDGRMLVAMAQTFGKCGDMVDVAYDNGLILRCTLGDEKNPNDANYNMYGHEYGGRTLVMEFEISYAKYQEMGLGKGYGSLAWPDWFGETVGARVTEVKNLGPIKQMG